MDSDGNFVVAWSSYPGYNYGSYFGGYAVQARRFDSNGSGIGDAFQVNSTVAWYSMNTTR